MKKFFTNISLLFVLPLIIVSSVWYWILKHSQFNNLGILNFQIEKLKQNQGNHYSILFIGDSSGGNAISSQKNKKIINLCLTGSFGYKSQIAFIKIVDKYITYDTVCIINTIDIPTRNIGPEIELFMDLHGANFLQKLVATFHYQSNHINHMKSCFNSLSEFQDRDYPKTQRRTLSDSNIINKSIRVERIADLQLLESFLINSNKKFKFFFGPSLPYSRSYFNHLVECLKPIIQYHEFNKPFALNGINKGDSEDHVHPEYSEKSTSYYLKILRQNSP